MKNLLNQKEGEERIWELQTASSHSSHSSSFNANLSIKSVSVVPPGWVQALIFVPHQLDITSEEEDNAQL